jgi:hypothetical protein
MSPHRPDQMDVPRTRELASEAARRAPRLERTGEDAEHRRAAPTHHRSAGARVNEATPRGGERGESFQARALEVVPRLTRGEHAASHPRHRH